MELLPLYADSACDTAESEQQSFDTTTPLDSGNAANRCDIHDNRNRKNTVPFLKSNYKYKRRLHATSVSSSQVNYSPVTVEQVMEVERFEPSSSPPPPPTPLSDSFVRVVAVGFIVSAIVVYRDILLNFLRRVARESRAWCINSNKIHHRWESEMSGEVKRRASNGSSRRRCGATAALGRSKSFGLDFVSAGFKLIYLTLFIALWMTVYEVEAGTCWIERRDNGNCETLYSKNMTKAQCCGKNQLFSYTEKNLSNVEYFFALALGGGTECVPCLESCKDVVCGPNKRCVKRKGRPKCICSPQCGSGKKHKKSHKRKHQQHQQNGSLKPPHVIDISRSKEHVSLVNFHSPITVRDVRSLSSEIHNNPSAASAMVLTSPGDPISQANSRRKNQRIPASTNPTKKQQVNLSVAPQQHRLHHHQQHHRHKQEQQHHTSSVTRRRHASADRDKGDKLIITADDLVRPSTHHENDLAESNSLRDRSSTPAAVATDNNHHHTPHQQQHGRHHFKKHTKPKRKFTTDHQNGLTHNSVHNGTKATTTMATGTLADRNEMKIAERRRHRTQSSDGHSVSFASSSPNQGFKQRKPTPLQHPSGSASNNNNHRDLHLGQDYADDLAFDDKIHNGFFSNGFPYPHQELSMDEDRYTHPVCGSDGRTYNTECQLKKRACRTDNTALSVAYRGHCQTSCKKVNCLNGLQCVEDNYAIPHCIVCPIKCSIDDNNGEDQQEKFDPARAVCGVDGNTYKSTCDINRMVCKIGRSIAVAYPGPCREDRTSCSSVSCGPKMSCLTDLVTHRPRCVACKFKCSRKRQPTNIRYEEGKLCGTNNRTYFSYCEMKKDSCQTGYYIDIKSIGECQQQG